MAENFLKFKGRPQVLKLWSSDGKVLGATEDLEDVFKTGQGVKDVKEVYVTHVNAETPDAIFVVSDRIPRVLESTQPKPGSQALVQLWNVFRGLKSSDYEPGSHLKIPQWKELCRLGLPVPRRHGLYIRECFPDLYTSVIKCFEEREIRFVHVNGTPGIGKSMFLWYTVLREASKKSCDIIVKRPGRADVVLVFPRQGDAYYAGGYQVFLNLPEDRNVLQLFAVYACGGANCTKYVPSWEMEREGFRTLCREELGEKYSEDVVSDVQACWGCTPRYVLDKKYGEADVTRIIRDCKDFWQAFQYAYVRQGSSDGGAETPPKLFQIVVQESSDSEEMRVGFASVYIRHRFFEEMWNRRKEQLLSFLSTSADLSDHATLRGLVFEDFGVGTMLSCSLRAESLLDVGEKNRYVGIILKRKEVRYFTEIDDIRDAHSKGEDIENYIWRPRQKNHRTFDLILPPYWMVQFAVQKTGHSVLASDLTEVHDIFVKMKMPHMSYLLAVPLEGCSWTRKMMAKLKDAKGAKDLKTLSRKLKDVGLYCVGLNLESQLVQSIESALIKQLPREPAATEWSNVWGELQLVAMQEEEETEDGIDVSEDPLEIEEEDPPLSLKLVEDSETVEVQSADLLVYSRKFMRPRLADETV